MIAKATMQAAKPTGLLQRACDCGGKSGCEQCKKKRLQRKADGASSQSAALPAFDRGGGAPVPTPIRQHLEPLFGTSFADVRLHDDGAAHHAARELHAQAFTFGQHVHFAAGHFRPQARDGLHLLAHELGHTVQQRGTSTQIDEAAIDAADSPLEREADSGADSVLAGRPARIRIGGAGAGAQAKLQRKEEERVVSENESVFVDRTLTEKPCSLTKTTVATPRKDIFFWDDAAQAVGLRYSICKGKVQLETGQSLDYSDVERAARDLITRVQADPASGNAALQDAVNSATITNQGHITFTVSKTLEVKVSNESSAGTQAQAAQVKIRVLVNTASDKVQVIAEAGVGISQDAIQREVEKFVKAELKLGPVRFEFKFTNTQTTPSGGGPTASQDVITAGPRVDVGKVGGGTVDFGCDVTKRGDDPAQLGCNFGVRGEAEKPKKVECYECVCPPPRPDYTCRRVIKGHTKDVVDQTADTQQQKLLYMYDSDAPAIQAEFDGQVGAIAGLLKADYTVKHIRGRASPEASIEYNEKLGLKRAKHTRAAIATKAGAEAAANLPAAEGTGELLGESSNAAQDEAKNKELIKELQAKLSPKSEEERLDLLGVSGPRRDDPVQRKKVLADIQDFIDGKDETGEVKRRAMWEKIFPHLRRVEIELQRPKKSHPEKVEAKDKPETCSDADKAFIDAKLGPIPAEKRLPQEECGR